tara:strand:- start:261 stop:437 length:177 start_codon:yes stop_codon:yes gene_type:complete
VVVVVDLNKIVQKLGDQEDQVVEVVEQVLLVVQLQVDQETLLQQVLYLLKVIMVDNLI